MAQMAVRAFSIPNPQGTQGTKGKLQIAHQVPGRIRIKVPSAKGRPELLAEIQRCFGSIPGIDEVVINPVTGSVVLKYDAEEHDAFHTKFTHHFNEHYADVALTHHQPPSTELDALADKIQEEADFLADHSIAAKVLVDFCRHCDRQIKLGSGNTFDLKMALCVGVVGFMIFELGAAAATPIWVTLSLFGLNHVIEMQSELATSGRTRRKKDAGHPDSRAQAGQHVGPIETQSDSPRSPARKAQ
jgi:Heavy metal associated domain 2